ncbi:hypothetical protein EU95_0703 [Prochlorococcus marinus str. MIT 9201]|uniref:Uncharacterized protein n=1 Tax=Prochlorococcus marinus str. MIT 9201 TaxID=93057 RepID=A0A0A2A7D3_PROMR|nr:hypothetical protein EU95_0703 [Prochlorococcus marinus str. MIT 9201]
MVKILSNFNYFFPFRIISKGKTISIRLPSINKKAFKFIYPFLSRYSN